MEVDAAADWELSFYSVTHVGTNEFLVKPHSSNPKSNPGSLFTTHPAGAQSPTAIGAATNQLGSRNSITVAPHRAAGLEHTGNGSFRGRGLSEKEGSHSARLEPLPPSHSSHMSPRHRGPGQHKDRTSQQPLADWEIPRKQEDHKRGDDLLETNIPRHMQHWATIDHGNGLYDFMSPSRLIGKPIVSPREHPQKGSARGRSMVLRGHEQGYKPKGQSVSLPDLAHSSKKESFTMHHPSNKHHSDANSPMISPLKGRLKPSYVKLNYSDIPIAQELQARQHADTKKKINKPVPPPPPPPLGDDEVIKRVIREQFKKYDLNGDGVISRKEAAMLLEQNVVDQDGDIKIALDFILSKMDFDQDQKVNYEEYERCVLKEPLLRGCFGGSGLNNKKD